MQTKTLSALLLERSVKTPDKTIYWTRNDGQWQSIRYKDLYYCVCDVARQLKQQGVQKNQVVAIMAATGMEWEIVHHALLLLGVVVIGLDPAEMPEQLSEIVGIAKVEHLVVDRCERFDKFNDASKAKLLSLITMEKNIPASKKISRVVVALDQDKRIYEADGSIMDSSAPTDIATIIFTSGTTGKPKGIAYRHEQVVAAIEAILKTYPELNEQPCRLVCWLPLSNLFQRIVNLCALASGAEVYFVEQPQKIIEYLPQISPHIFIAVPRFYEKLYQGLQNNLAEQPKFIGSVLQVCLSLGERQDGLGALFKKLNIRLFGSFRKLFGNDLHYLVSGSAPMPVWLLKRFDALGLLVLEAYGLSENVVPIAANSLTDYRFGTVGKAMSGNLLVLAEDGELLVKGLGVFDGYLANGVSEENLTPDGCLATGDYVEIDAQGYVRLVGRKSEVFKTSTGRKIAPVAIEALLQSIPQIEHAMIVGENRKYLVALITLGDLIFENQQDFKDFVQTVSNRAAAMFAGWPEYKKPVGLVACLGSLRVDQQELTVNLKLRRKVIMQHYVEFIDELYQALDDPEATIHQQPLSKVADVVLCKL